MPEFSYYDSIKVIIFAFLCLASVLFYFHEMSKSMIFDVYEIKNFVTVKIEKFSRALTQDILSLKTKVIHKWRH